MRLHEPCAYQSHAVHRSDHELRVLKRDAGQLPIRLGLLHAALDRPSPQFEHASVDLSDML